MSSSEKVCCHLNSSSQDFSHLQDQRYTIKEFLFHPLSLSEKIFTLDHKGHPLEGGVRKNAYTSNQ